MEKEMEKNEKKDGIITRAVRYLIDNPRTMILGLATLVFTAGISIVSLRPEGFPNPTVDLVVVNTVYLGASPETMLEEVTEPIESAAGTVDGVRDYQSFTSGSASNVQFYIETGSDVNQVKDLIETEVDQLSFPGDANDPRIVVPTTGANTIEFNLVPTSDSITNEDLFNATEAFSREIEDLDLVSRVQQGTSFEKRLVLDVSLQNLIDNGYTQEQLQLYGVTDQALVNTAEQRLKTFNKSLPVVSDITLQEVSDSSASRTSLSLKLGDNSLEELKSLQFVFPDRTGQNNGAPLVLTIDEFADINNEYGYNGGSNLIAINQNGRSIVANSIHLTVFPEPGTDIVEFGEEVEEKIFDLKELEEFKDIEIVTIFSTAEQTEEQIGEVISGLVGGPVDSWGPFAWTGFVLGALQLVFLVMLAFVSWRAAIVATLAIPLSIFFSTIYLNFIGETLNTIVLFSLVLAIGLVVDPALVLLEAVQRYIDQGVKKKEAVLSAIREVGPGVFLAFVTNVIVFVPFGVITGFIGEIFKYIPLTIIPALVGSYVVPIFVISYLGSIFFKKSKNKTEDEEKNLWAVARWVQKINYKIVNLNPVWRILIVVVSLVVPIGVAGGLSATGQVTQTDFSQPVEFQYIQINTEFNSTDTLGEKAEKLKELLSTVAENENVDFIATQTAQTQVGSSGGGESLEVGTVNMSPLIKLKSLNDLTKTSPEILEEIKESTEELKSNFEDLSFQKVGNTGPLGGVYDFTISLTAESKEEITPLAQDIEEQLLDYEIDGEKPVEKVNIDFLSNIKTRYVLELTSDASTTNPVNPQDLAQFISSQFTPQKEVENEVSVDNNQLEIVLSNSALEPPKTIDEVVSSIYTDLAGNQVPISQLVTVTESEESQGIVRTNGDTVYNIQVRTGEDFKSQGILSTIQNDIVNYYKEEFEGKDFLKNQNLTEEVFDAKTISPIDFGKSINELLQALILAIILSYAVLVIFFNSFTQPINILFAIPLTFLGVFPSLAFFASGEIGFLEIIGIIILIGIVENVAIFLINNADNKMKENNWDSKKAISYATGLRFRPILLTAITTTMSLLPLIFFSEFYKSIGLVVVSGTITAGVLSLFTTPVLYVYFKWLSYYFRSSKMLVQALFSGLTIGLVISLGIIGSAIGALFPMIGIGFLVAIVVFTGFNIYWYVQSRQNTVLI